MAQGWVYILLNPSMPGLVKVGQTSRLPAERAVELSRATGVAVPFVVVFEQEFADCVAAERDIHAILDRCGMRHMPNREFFRGPIPAIIQIILSYATETGEATVPASAQSGLELLRLGDRHLFGDGDMLQDLHEAVRCYQLAAKRGAVVAFERLGAIVGHLQGQARGSKTRAMGYLREGARRGNYFCYCEIATLAAEEGHVANFIKAWDRFFRERETAFLSEAEAGANRYPVALQRYVVACFALGITPGHVAALEADAEALARTLAEALKRACDQPRDRRHLILSLRWVHRTLLHRRYAGDSVPIWARLRLWGRWRDAPA